MPEIQRFLVERTEEVTVTAASAGEAAEKASVAFETRRAPDGIGHQPPVVTAMHITKLRPGQ